MPLTISTVSELERAAQEARRLREIEDYRSSLLSRGRFLRVLDRHVDGLLGADAMLRVILLLDKEMRSEALAIADRLGLSETPVAPLSKATSLDPLPEMRPLEGD